MLKKITATLVLHIVNYWVRLPQLHFYGGLCLSRKCAALRGFGYGCCNYVLLDVPASLLKCYPFPGPGLAVCFPDDVTQRESLCQADEIFIQAIKDAGIYDEIWQALPVKTSGVELHQNLYWQSNRNNACVSNSWVMYVHITIVYCFLPLLPHF
nr:GMP synthase [glutamine-hydrolyzing] [Tanacetum cinerariifolium]